MYIFNCIRVLLQIIRKCSHLLLLRSEEKTEVTQLEMLECDFCKNNIVLMSLDGDNNEVPSNNSAMANTAAFSPSLFAANWKRVVGAIEPGEQVKKHEDLKHSTPVETSRKKKADDVEQDETDAGTGTRNK